MQGRPGQVLEAVVGVLETPFQRCHREVEGAFEASTEIKPKGREVRALQLNRAGGIGVCRTLARGHPVTFHQPAFKPFHGV